MTGIRQFANLSVAAAEKREFVFIVPRRKGIEGTFLNLIGHGIVAKTKRVAKRKLELTVNPHRQFGKILRQDA